MTDLAVPAGSLVVSCQALPGNPLRSPEAMVLMARAAEAGGAAAIRANGATDIAAIRAAVALPIIGIHKTDDRTGPYITPTYEDAARMVQAGANVVAVDGTARPRPGGALLSEQIERIHRVLGVPVMADVNSLESGTYARQAGADLVATTLSGYTSGSVVPDDPDLSLVAELAARLDCPIVAEGRYRTPEQVRAARSAGAYAVVVGGAITNPMAITARLRGAFT